MSRIKYRRFIRGKIDLRSLLNGVFVQQKFMVLIQLRKHTKNWKGVQLLDKLIKKSENAVYFPSRRAAHAIKKGHRVAHKQKCLIIGAGPCGLRTAIEMAFMGASVTVIDSRKEFR